VSTRTHYDTLGVKPGDSQDVIHNAYWTLATDCVPQENWAWTTMKWMAKIRSLQEYNAAMLVIGHSDHRESYDRKLRRQLLICTLCEGKGAIAVGPKDIFGRQNQSMYCAACQGTGKAVEAPAA
jgi:DnaJ-class molecular chaperone